MSQQEKSEKLVQLLKQKLGNQIAQMTVDRGDAVVWVRRDAMLDFFKILKLDSELDFNMLVSETCVDWLDSKVDRFELVYHLLSLKNLYRLRVKIPLPESQPEIESLTSLYQSANFMEREIWDMFGVRFKGHPDLRRILMWEGYEGHPLRKDYPVQSKQPRVPLRSPEVENTATKMVRPPLVQINKKRGESSTV